MPSLTAEQVGGGGVVPFESLYNCWVEAINAAWMYARGERLGELRGKRVQRFDPQGVHPYSLEWGRIMAYEVLDLSLMELRFCGEPNLTPISMKKLAYEDAEEEFFRFIRESE